MNPILARLFAACEQSGYALGEAEKDQILGAIDGVADQFVDNVVTAIADNLPDGGVKSVEWGPIKGALLQSETEMDGKVNDQISGLFDKLLGILHEAKA